jgi:hypothetical protein
MPEAVMGWTPPNVCQSDGVVTTEQEASTPSQPALISDLRAEGFGRFSRVEIGRFRFLWLLAPGSSEAQVAASVAA